VESSNLATRTCELREQAAQKTEDWKGKKAVKKKGKGSHPNSRSSHRQRREKGRLEKEEESNQIKCKLLIRKKTLRARRIGEGGGGGKNCFGHLPTHTQELKKEDT